MKRITTENYKKDKYYPRVVRAVSKILSRVEVVAPVELFMVMELLRKNDCEDWRFGRVPYLEKVIRCNLSTASRILQLLRMHAHDLDLCPSPTDYRKWGKGKKIPLRFSKTRHRPIEAAYSRHFVTIQALNATRRAKEARHERVESDAIDSNPLSNRNIQRVRTPRPDSGK